MCTYITYISWGQDRIAVKGTNCNDKDMGLNPTATRNEKKDKKRKNVTLTFSKVKLIICADSPDIELLGY